MDDDHSKGNNTTVDSAKADRSIWLMKCPPVVSKAWQSSAASGDSPPLAKVVVSLDPLQSEDPSALQVNIALFFPVYDLFVWCDIRVPLLSDLMRFCGFYLVWTNCVLYRDVISEINFIIYVGQFTMEMAGNEVVNMPKSYSLNMFKDFVPMCVFSQTNQGESSLFTAFSFPSFLLFWWGFNTN